MSDCARVAVASWWCVGSTMSDAGGECILYTDGGARGNPGPAGAGWVLLAPDGAVLSEGGVFIGTATNNVAEYEALLAGLRVAGAEKCARVEVRSDSELLVRQMTGAYKVKNAGLKPLFTSACALVATFQSVRFTHVRREQNTDADRLANEAMDACGDVGDAERAAHDRPHDTLF